MKKAQAAMEFLMTYGWAILVVLVAIGALAYFGVLSPDKFLPEKCIISTGSGLFCDKFSIDADSVDFKIKNSLADPVYIAVGAAEVSDGTNSCKGPTAVVGEVTIAADDDGTLILPDNGADGTCALLLATEKVKADITITFTDEAAGAGFSKTTTGSLIAKTP